MRINKAAIGLLLYAITILTGCSFIDETIDNANPLVKNKLPDALPQQQNSDKNAVTLVEDALSSKHTVYFLQDSSEVEPGSISMIEKQSQYLLDNSNYTLVLEGHADERGSREYNIALAEERANAVAKMLQARGVQATRLEIVSYGEEKLASPERNEASSSLNQRVNLIFQRTQK